MTVPAHFICPWKCAGTVIYTLLTLTCITGNINSEKYKTILEDNIWPVIARHFPENQYLFHDDNAPVHRSRVLQEYKAKNNLKSIS